MTKHDDKRDHRFGGPWTETKLAILRKYLSAYTTALKKHAFVTGYIDAFAGTGYRTQRDGDDAQLALPDLADDESQALLKGSAALALETSPPFDRYVFIERDTARCKSLERLKTEYPALAPRIVVMPEEANAAIRSLCSKRWTNHRAVLFLDPYGMQVEWQTIEAVAATQKIDLWLLVPFGIGVNRLLTRSGEIPEGWRRRLDTLLGTTDWFDTLYRVEQSPSLFERDATRRVKVNIEAIGKYLIERLRQVFPAVASNPKVLRNAANNPMYLFCFAAGNPSGGKVAVKIAQDILKKIDEWP